MAFIAHVQRLCNQGAQIYAAAARQGCAHSGAKHSVHPAQARKHFFAVGTVAQHFAIAFVQVGVGGVGAACVWFVFHHVHQHRGGGYARHRPDGIVLVARFKLHAATFSQRDGLSFGARQPFKQHGANHGAAQRAGHARPGKRRAGMQQQVAVHARDHIARGSHPGQHRPRLHHARDGGLIGLFNVHASSCHAGLVLRTHSVRKIFGRRKVLQCMQLVLVHLRQNFRQLGVAGRRRAPVKLQTLCALCRQAVVKSFDAGVQCRHWLCQGS